ncbi:MAG: cupin domain-containing protein [Ilumatobacteraceae bacterium]
MTSSATSTKSSEFRDVSGAAAIGEPDYWQPVICRKVEIDAEIERLASLDRPGNGRRSAVFTHPRSPSSQPSLAPGIRVSLDVLLPGECTAPIRHNSTQFGFCIAGSGDVTIGGTHHRVQRYDGWNHPSWRAYTFTNTGSTPFVRLTYSNAPILEKLNVHLVEDLAEMPSSPLADGGMAGDEIGVAGRRRSPFGTFELADGAFLMPYETLIDPPALPSPALHWPWQQMQVHLDRLEALGESYTGRRLYLMYNPLTGRTNGTTPSLFATITIRPPSIVDRPHRHVSAAINYFFRGSGWSRIGGQRYEWEAGDLMLTAPGWMIHHHASDDGDRVYELTVQDQPLNIAMESLLWQEDLKHPPRVLGSESGFTTTSRQRREMA